MEVSSNYHLGHILMERLKIKPNFIYQIDAATGEQITNAEVLSKSIQLAKCLRNLNLQPGDVLAMSGRKHIDINIPFNAALFNGYPISAVDPLFKYDEIKTLLKITQPKVVFCEPEAYEYYEKAVQALELNAKIVTYGKGDTIMASFIKEFEDNSEPETDFQVANFDVEKIYAFLVSTSGTTGKIKAAAITHKAMFTKIMGHHQLSVQNMEVNNMYLHLSPVNWMMSYYSALAIPYAHDCLLVTSKPPDADHLIEIINKYKPMGTVIGPAMLLNLLNRLDEIDLTSFNYIIVSGSKCHSNVFAKIQSRLKEGAAIINVYGLTETIGTMLMPTLTPIGSCGKQSPYNKIKLVDPDTGIEIKEAHVTGELWCKGATFSTVARKTIRMDDSRMQQFIERGKNESFWDVRDNKAGIVKLDEYYNNPEETAQCITSDGYIKTGDLLYMDEEHNYFYVDRIKELIKYRNYPVQPSEIEELICELPGVREVCVVGILSDDEAIGQLPAACVIRQEGADVTAQQIKDHVSSKLSSAKELRGGVVFLSEFPLTSSGKIRKIELLETAKKSLRK